MYCTCVLRMPEKRGRDVQSIKACEQEIAACKWMDYEEVMAMPFYQQSPVFTRSMSIAHRVATTGEGGLAPERLEFGFGRGAVSLLHARL